MARRRELCQGECVCRVKGRFLPFVNLKGGYYNKNVNESNKIERGLRERICHPLGTRNIKLKIIQLIFNEKIFS